MTGATAVWEEEARWQAVLAHDARWDGAFVYAVRSTGIYCRPSCPSRRPRRREVSFFQAATSAEQAGFRACRRCRPDRKPEADPAAAKIRQACLFIEAHSAERITLNDLATHVGYSPHHLQRTFTRLLGVSPRQYADACRLGQLKAELKDGTPVTTALYDAGYGSSSRLYERANGAMGMTPATYGRGGLGMRVGFTILDSAYGRLLVAATERGISSVKLGDEDASLEADLRHEYPAAEVVRDDHRIRRLAEPLLDHLKGSRPHLQLPIDVQATAFQWRVWRQLLRIPYGRTQSYGEVARRLGHPTAARAVARACATNPVALVIPCHRVVQSDGRLGGYRWGVERKKALIEQERNARSRKRA